jgi:hypothetical protein
MLPIRVAPDPMIGCLQLDIGSKIHAAHPDVSVDEGGVLSTL